MVEFFISKYSVPRQLCRSLLVMFVAAGFSAQRPSGTFFIRLCVMQYYSSVAVSGTK